MSSVRHLAASPHEVQFSISSVRYQPLGQGKHTPGFEPTRYFPATHFTGTTYEQVTAVRRMEGKPRRHIQSVNTRNLNCKVNIWGFAKKQISKNPSLLWKWVGRSRSHSEFFFFFENHPKITLNQYRCTDILE